MRLAKPTRTLLPLALSAVLVTCAWGQEHPNVQPNMVREKLNQASAGAPPPAAPQATTPPAGKSSAAPAPKAPAKAKAPAAAPAAAKDASKTPAKPGADAKGAAKTAAAASGKPGDKPAEEKAASRRDPFDTLLTKARAGNAPPENLPPGKAGLIIDTLRIDGIVHSPNGTIAIVSNAQQRVYFLREGDKLYDGSVQKIALDAISFNAIGKDAFGKPLERVVTRRLYPTSGEQQ